MQSATVDILLKDALHVGCSRISCYGPCIIPSLPFWPAFLLLLLLLLLLLQIAEFGQVTKVGEIFIIGNRAELRSGAHLVVNRGRSCPRFRFLKILLSIFVRTGRWTAVSPRRLAPKWRWPRAATMFGSTFLGGRTVGVVADSFLFSEFPLAPPEFTCAVDSIRLKNGR